MSHSARHGCGSGRQDPRHAIALEIQPLTDARQRTGKAAEDLATARLVADQWRIIERNARTRHGEIDIVAMHGSRLVFVEVKAGRDSSTFGPERPALAVVARKQQRIRRLATAWISSNTLPYFTEIRFDVIGVLFSREGEILEVEHIRGAF